MWTDALSRIFSTVKDTIEILKVTRTLYKYLTERDLTIADVKSQLENGCLDVGDTIGLIGLFSGYLPFVDLRTLGRTCEPHVHSHVFTTRLLPVNNVYCAAIYEPDQTRSQVTIETKEPFTQITRKMKKGRPFWRIEELFANKNVSSPCVPLFYSKYPFSNMDESVRLSNHSSGEILELKCKICEIPDEWSQIILPADSFSYFGADGSIRRFGLRVIDCDYYGLSDIFLINSWIAGRSDLKTAVEVTKDWRGNKARAQMTHSTENICERADRRLLEMKSAIQYSMLGRWKMNSWLEYRELSETFFETGMYFRLPNLAEFCAQNVNVRDLRLLNISREFLGIMAKAAFKKVDFQYDQTNLLAKQTMIFP